MNDTKSPFASKTIWGAALMLISLALNAFGYDLTTEDQALVVETVVTAVGAIGTLLAIYGRLTATRKISNS